MPSEMNFFTNIYYDSDSINSLHAIWYEGYLHFGGIYYGRKVVKAKQVDMVSVQIVKEKSSQIWAELFREFLG
ncbi:hypothetical protein ACQKMK_02345 [Viridibacillus arvi]|uniref:hypothetical protein n=1 Tax=Viridibacillus arvi TaxID=263475 RepID=UPI003CFD6512